MFIILELAQASVRPGGRDMNGFRIRERRKNMSLMLVTRLD